jgi:hypothetical protein
LLLRSGIKGDKDGKEVGRSEFLAMDKIWELADAKFVREDILSNKIAQQLRNQYFLPSSNKSNRTAGPAESLSSSPTGRGRSKKIREGITKEMIKMVVAKKMTEQELRTATGEALVADFGHAPATVRAARDDALLKLPEIIRNSKSDN